MKIQWPTHKDTNKSLYDDEVMSVLEALSLEKAGTEKYDQLLDQLNKLMDARAKLGHRGPDANTWLTVGGTFLLGIIMLKFEKTEVITSKVFGFLGHMKA